MRVTNPRRWLALGLALAVLGVPAVGSATIGADGASARTPVDIKVPRKIKKPGARFVDGGTFSTPMGTARWVQLAGHPGNLPRSMHDVLPAPGGYVVLSDARGNRDARGTDIWFSPDLLRWTRMPSPKTAPQGDTFLTTLDSSFWLASNRRERAFAEVWRSPDAREWTAIDTSAVVPRWPAELGWESTVGRPAEVDGIVALPVEFRLAEPGALLGLSEAFGRHVQVVPSQDGGYDVFDGWGMFIVNLVFEETPDGVRVIEPVSGEDLSTIDGVDLSFIDWWASTRGSDLQVGTVDGDRLRSASLPPLGSDEVAGRPTIFGSEDVGFRAYSRVSSGSPDHEPLGYVEWASSDGATWSEPMPFGTRDGQPPDITDLDAGADWILASNHDERPRVEWRSSDGRTWQPIGSPGDKAARSLPFADGWLNLGLRRSEYQASWEPFSARRSRHFDLGPIGPVKRFEWIGPLGDSGFYLREKLSNSKVNHYFVTIDGLSR